MFSMQCPHPNCDWAFTKNYKLRRHIESHSGSKEFEVSGHVIRNIVNVSLLVVEMLTITKMDHVNVPFTIQCIIS